MDKYNAIDSLLNTCGTYVNRYLSVPTWIVLALRSGNAIVSTYAHSRRNIVEKPVYWLGRRDWFVVGLPGPCYWLMRKGRFVAKAEPLFRLLTHAPTWCWWVEDNVLGHGGECIGSDDLDSDNVETGRLLQEGARWFGVWLGSATMITHLHCSIRWQPTAKCTAIRCIVMTMHPCRDRNTRTRRRRRQQEQANEVQDHESPPKKKRNYYGKLHGLATGKRMVVAAAAEAAEALALVAQYRK